MIQKKIGIVTAVLVAICMLATPSWATFHTFRFKQVFSDAAGKVQFIEMQESLNENDEDEFGGKILRSLAHEFTFPTNLASEDTASKFLLIASQSYAALANRPAPDFIVPDGFVNTNGDSLNFPGADLWDFGPLPTNGKLSLFRDGTTGTNQIENFNRETGSIEITTAAVPLPPAVGMFFTALPIAFIAFRKMRTATA